ncbi:hypothetical protein LZP73_09670 [Shewanella sp. AS16]|uniref:hypothetical protein n=1 Tax=Shewanella sp. AS16 TaxID=2907625 RepID=UPI001F204763|nr:hypothetical protein [Shewanella sp. AS16]MCE9686479.1 hypothetical protein [Shewanella sp. AS16]
MSSCSSEFDRFVDVYKNGGTLRLETQAITRNAKTLFDRAKIVSKLEQAKLLRELSETLFESQPPFRDLALNASLVQQEFYRYLEDDILIMAAFELFAKAFLLKCGYLIHKIKSPSNLHKQQNRKPVSFSTYRAELKRREDIQLLLQTLSVSTLLKTEYVRLLEFAPEVVSELSRINERRNKIHLVLCGTVKMDMKALRAIEYLGQRINAELIF